MISLIPYLYLIGLSVIFGIMDGLRWLDELDGVTDPKRLKPKWKAASLALRVLVWVSPFVFSRYGVSVWDYFLALAISWPVFDMTINVTARGLKSIFYLGKTSKFDALGRFKWWAALALIIITLILKLSIE